jgi:hypothetical protein
MDNGRGSRVRTRGLRFWRPPLYQLSYTPLGRERLFSQGDVEFKGFPKVQIMTMRRIAQACSRES